MDDLNVSHVDSFEIAKLSGYLPRIYEGLMVRRGKVHEYLGMDLNYSKKGTVKVSMIKFLGSVLQ